MEGLTFESVVAFTRSWDVVYFGVMFVAALGYALWPSNQAGFRQAAQIPLNDDGDI